MRYLPFWTLKKKKKKTENIQLKLKDTSSLLKKKQYKKTRCNIFDIYNINTIIILYYINTRPRNFMLRWGLMTLTVWPKNDLVIKLALHFFSHYSRVVCIVYPICIYVMEVLINSLFMHTLYLDQVLKRVLTSILKAHLEKSPSGDNCPSLRNNI